MTANVIYGAFLRHIPRATISRKTGSYEEELLRAKDQGYTYLVQPEILHWEERATEWSGKSDRIKIRISIAEAETGNVIDSEIITGKSKWVTFGGDHPQDLLPTPINKYVVSLFR